MLCLREKSSAKWRPLKSWPELQIRITQLAGEGSPPPGLRLPQAKLPRNSNQIARGRIRRFESYMPSQAVWSLWAVGARGIDPRAMSAAVAKVRHAIKSAQSALGAAKRRTDASSGARSQCLVAVDR
jgi:hypothetical protein